MSETVYGGKFVRVQVKYSYIVPNNPEQIEIGKDALYDDLMESVKFDTLYTLIDAVPAPEATADQVPEFITDTLDDEDEEEQQRRDEKNGLYPGKDDIAN